MKNEIDNVKFDEEVLYMKKSISRIIGLIMLIIAIVFIMFALNHPEKSFPWNNTITWLLYGVYFLVTVVLLIAPKMKQWESKGKNEWKTCCPCCLTEGLHMRKFGVSDVDQLDGFGRPTKKEKRKSADLWDSDIPKKIVFF